MRLALPEWIRTSKARLVFRYEISDLFSSSTHAAAFRPSSLVPRLFPPPLKSLGTRLSDRQDTSGHSFFARPFLRVFHFHVSVIEGQGKCARVGGSGNETSV